MFKVSISQAASNDIRSIARYTQDTWGADQRRRYLNGLNEKFEMLSSMPEMGKERRDFRPPVRIVNYERHLIIYVIDGEEILIVRVLHQSQDVPARLTD